jgi:hypothetical protein
MKFVKKRGRKRQKLDFENDRIDRLTQVICAILSVVVILSGVICSLNQNLAAGGMLISLGIVLAALARKLRRFRVRLGVGGFEIEAQHD